MDRIFISYRREDSAATCGRIYDRLVARFGKDNVFKDVESIPLGVNFEHYIGDVVAQCAVQLVVMGPTWLDIPTEDGQRRLDEANDLVRVEIEAALNRNIPVIPVLVQGATLPRASALPQTLKELVSRNGIPVRYDPDFEPDVARLINALETWMAGRGASQGGLAGATGAANGPGPGPGAAPQAPAGAAQPGQARPPMMPQPGMPPAAGAVPPAQPGAMPPANAGGGPMSGAPLWAAAPPGGMRPAGMPQGQPGGMPPGAIPQGQPQMGGMASGGMPPGAMPPGAMSAGMMPPGAMPPGAMPNQPGMASPPSVPLRPAMPPYQGAPSFQASAPTYAGAPSYQPAPSQMPPTMPGGGGPTQPGGPFGGQSRGGGGSSGGGGGNRNMGLIIGGVAAVLVIALVISVLAVVLSQGGPKTTNNPTRTPSATATPTPTIAYQSKLNSQSAVNGWIGDSNCVWSTDGIHLTGASGTNYCLAPTEADITDGTISVDMKEITAGTGTTFFGLAFRAVSSSTNFTGYTFDINDNGQWCFGKTLTAGGNLTPVSGCDNTASAAIHTNAGASNTVVVRMKGPHFTFTVNGEVVAQADDSDVTSQTVVGVYVSQGEEVVFTNFVVTK